MNENISGLVNVQDASNHGAAVIYGNTSNKSAVDEYLDRVDKIKQQQAALLKQEQQQSSKDNAAILKEIGKVWSPYSQDVKKKYDDWQKLQSKAILSKDSKEKYDAQAQADMQMNDILTTVSISEEQKKLSEATDRLIINNPEWFTPEEIAYHVNWKGRTDANSANERYEPIMAKKQTRISQILKNPNIKPTYQPISIKNKIDGTDVMEYYDQAQITPQQLDDAYNAYAITPDIKYAKQTFVDEQIKAGKTADEASALFKQSVQQQWLNTTGAITPKLDKDGNVEYYYSRKLKYATKENNANSNASQVDISGYDYGHYNKAGNIELVKDEQGYNKPYYSGQTNEDFVEVAPTSIADLTATKGQKAQLQSLGTDRVKLSVAKGIIKKDDGSIWIDVNVEKPATGYMGTTEHLGNQELMIVDASGKKTNAYNFASNLYHGAIKLHNGKIVPDRASAKLQGSRNFGDYDKVAQAAPAGGGTQRTNTQAAPAKKQPQKSGRKKWNQKTKKIEEY